MSFRRTAFSLIELSIVLVILGLLTGGILAGQSLIRASELRSVITDATKYRTAVSAFRDKYFALPGDMPNATSVWGARACSLADNTLPVATETCNGNDDGSISWGLPDTTHGESFLAWQHLSSAGLIGGNYSGLQGPGTYAASEVGGLNVPSLRLNSGCIGLHGIGSGATNIIPTANSMNPNVTSGNVLLLGKTVGSNPDYCYGAEFTPMDAWNIDTKMDDGVAYSGKMFAWVRANCTTNTTPGSGDYLLTYSNPICALMLRLDV